MKYLAVFLALILAGCTTVPVERHFPDVPEELTKPCAKLQQTPKDAKFSEILGVVTRNYSHYHDCSIQNDAWKSWYEQQKKIFEEVK